MKAVQALVVLGGRYREVGTLGFGPPSSYFA